jgi:mannose-6-phosphate isomerase-like protein (cupin superfamily)
VPDSDVVYLVVNGSGFFVTDEERQPFGPGDLLFAAAGTERHFDGFTPDFAVWVIAAG